MCLCTCAHSIVVWHVNIVTTKESILLWTGALCTHDVSGLPVQFCPSALKVYPSSHVVSVIVMVQNCSKAGCVRIVYITVEFHNNSICGYTVVSLKRVYNLPIRKVSWFGQLHQEYPLRQAT